MSRHHTVLSDLSAAYLPPASLRQAHARLKYAAKELHGGSIHRGIDVLQLGRCELPCLPFSNDLDVHYTPPELPWTVDLPHKLKVADRKLRAALAAIDGGGVEAALRVLRYRQDVQDMNGR